ncbi:MAG: type II toxin-antitoxin system VapC family toxin [Deltaproteobacteria bacterium]|nr:type II toxin-antitoxin system VapC family toxin [Deltaproteobacteria bacterium]
MILVDSSVWIDHLRKGDRRLASLLEDEQVLVHPYVIGELACGKLRRRYEILGLLRALPQADLAGDAEVHHLLETRRLWGRGLGWVDMHLLASALLSRCTLWTRDRRLAAVASEITGEH